MVVGRKRCRLEDEDICAAHVFLDLDENLHVGEAPDAGLGQGSFQIVGNRLGKGGIRVPGDELERTILAHLYPPPLLSTMAAVLSRRQQGWQ